MTESNAQIPEPRTTNARWIKLAVVLLGLGLAVLVGQAVDPSWLVTKASIDVLENDQGLLYTVESDKRVAIDSVLDAAALAALPEAERDGQVVTDASGGYQRVTATRHWGVFSLMPALLAIVLAIVLREPLIALLIGIASGAFLVGRFDLTEEVLMPVLQTSKAAGVLLLYLWLLGGLMGIWSKTGAAAAFADWAARRLVRGPRSAKVVAWALGIVFFQGGTLSTVLVGTSVKPLADKEKVSHEELSYIVDSTASPIAILLAFNAWPAYVQAFIFVPGVALLATQADREAFFFASLPLSFYAWFAVLGTLLLALDLNPFVGKGMKAARKRARETGQLDRPGSEPMIAPEFESSDVPSGYRPSVWEFTAPLLVLTGVAIGTFAATGSPQVRWAFGLAVLSAAIMALVRGMSLRDLMEGIGNGLKGVVVASVILTLAIALGTMTEQAGGGAYLVAVMADVVPYTVLPAALMVLTMAIAFATGTSWGTYAVAFPLAMPLAVALSESAELENPILYLMVCFAAVLNGSVYGDQCSPVSDTTILSSMTTGADLIDHVKTQLFPATLAAVLAIGCWQVVVFAFC
ncbi:MAG: Na+/H+ antiporter NhaC family protein [Planctomycetota bacterium]